MADTPPLPRMTFSLAFRCKVCALVIPLVQTGRMLDHLIVDHLYSGEIGSCLEKIYTCNTCGLTGRDSLQMALHTRIHNPPSDR